MIAHARSALSSVCASFLTHTVGIGNETMAINDPRGSDEVANVSFVEITHKGWPYVFVFAKNRHTPFYVSSFVLFVKGLLNVQRTKVISV